MYRHTSPVSALTLFWGSVFSLHLRVYNDETPTLNMQSDHIEWFKTMHVTKKPWSKRPKGSNKRPRKTLNTYSVCCLSGIHVYKLVIYTLTYKLKFMLIYDHFLIYNIYI